MGFPQAVVAEALTKCNRCCCICHKFCGTKIELHHIRQKAYGGEDTLENCIPLCFDCHADMGKADPKHPKGKHYSESELIKHRDSWYAKCTDIPPAYYFEVTEEDKKLFSMICDCFDGDTSFALREYDFRGTYMGRWVDKLYELSEKFKSPLNEFVNVEMEKLRANLESEMNAFLRYLSINTFPAGNDMPGYFATRLWLLDQGEIRLRDRNSEEKMREQFSEEGNRINELAGALWESYSAFVRQGRRIISA